MRRWTRRRTVVTVCASLLAIWLIAVAWLLVSARSQMTAGAGDLRHVRARASITAVLAPSSRAELRSASQHFDAAASTLDSPVLAPLQVLPVAGRHLDAAQHLAGASQDGTAAAEAALRSLTVLTRRSSAKGPARVRTLRDLAAVSGRTRRALEAVDPGSADGLIGPLGDAVVELDQQRDDASHAAGQLQSTSLALADVLQGPTSYLLLGANNAEMRNGSGMFLSASELRFDQGRLALGDVRPSAELVLPVGKVKATGDLAANWPWLDPARDLRNLGLTADFPQSADVAAQNWAAVPGGGPVDGVIAIDVDGLRSLLRVVGPVEIDGVRYTADTVRGELLRKQYQRFDGDRQARRDRLGDVARAVFDRLEAGGWKTDRLATELADAVEGRHLMIWSKDAKAAAAWRSAGADGHLTDHSLSIGLLNRGAAKLDSWVDTSADVTFTALSGGRHRITVRYDVVNRAPGTGPAYVIGPNVKGLRAGDHAALVVVNLPAGSSQVDMRGADVFLSGGDGPTVVIGGRLLVPRGKTAEVTVTAVLPAGVERITREPSARISPTTWTVEGDDGVRDRRHTVTVTD